MPVAAAKRIRAKQYQNLSRYKDRRTVDCITLNRSQRLVCLIERKRLHFRLQVDLRRYLQKIASIGARHIRYAAQLPLAPQQFVVIKFRYTIEMNRVDRDHTAFAQT